MVELLAVIFIIGMLAAAALPAAIRILRDRRVSSAATAIWDQFRMASMRAQARGSAVMVRWDAAMATVDTTHGHVVVREAVLGGGGGDSMLPVASCLTPDWSDGADTSKPVSSFDERRNEHQKEVVGLVMEDSAAIPQAYAEFCFTPRGRVFYRNASNGAWAPLAEVFRLVVRNLNTGKRWYVVISSTGAAKVVSEL